MFAPPVLLLLLLLSLFVLVVLVLVAAAAAAGVVVVVVVSRGAQRCEASAASITSPESVSGVYCSNSSQISWKRAEAGTSTRAAKSRISSAEREHREKKRRLDRWRRSTERRDAGDSFGENMWMGSASSSCRHSRRANPLRTSRTSSEYGR
jgi:hypothetical protein